MTIPNYLGIFKNQHISVSFQPYFLSINGTLLFYYFEAGTNPIAFEPSRLQRRLYLGQLRGWSSAEAWGQESEVAWQYHVQDGDDLGYTIRYLLILDTYYNLHISTYVAYLGTV